MSDRNDLIEELRAVAEDRHGAKNTHLLSWLEKGYFHCQHGPEKWCQGDYLDSAKAYIERLEAISQNALATIARLEAEVEAGKRERNATAARFARLHTIASKIRWSDLGLPAMNVASTQEGLTELSQFLLQDALEACLDRQGLPRTEGERA
ncbi:hypothetical protein [Aureimonas sp. N4]|uniref:hypothetical protein n=1 Tax=Aureimonas sp. N4 TaxID=1638165 RepID=UPI00078661CA|nr:hypothetical protein [Aureimonas sp. N4]